MISAQTISFLEGLRENNNKPWFDLHKKQYQEAQSELTELVKRWQAGVGKFDADILLLEPKKCIFRIYRDVRFSKDKTPYKNNLGAYLSGGGKNISRAGYYFHLEPGNNMFASGLYLPEGPALDKVRQEIDYQLPEFKAILHDPVFLEAFPEGLSKEHQLKNPPKGYDKDHPAIDLLKLKSLVVFRKLEDREIIGSNLMDTLIHLSYTAYPLVDFLNRSLD